MAGPPPRGAALDELQNRFKEWDATALRLQARATRFEQVTALLGPIAVLLLTLQVLIFPAVSVWAILLIVLELLALIITLVVGYTSLSPSPNGWMRARIRAEVLRREQYLVAARVGPYLNIPSPPDPIITQRLITILNTETDALALVAPAEPNGLHWREMLEEAGVNHTVPPTQECFGEFREHRLRDQRGWFSRRATFHETLHLHFEDAAKIVIVLALVVSAMHLALLVSTMSSIESGSAFQLVIEVAAIVLPPVGSALTALQTIAEGRRLGLSYRFHADALNDLDLRFDALDSNKGVIADPQWNFELKRLVLRTEEVLAGELRLWWLLRSSAK